MMGTRAMWGFIALMSFFTIVCCMLIGIDYVPFFAEPPTQAAMPRSSGNTTEETMRIRGRTLRERCGKLRGSQQVKQPYNPSSIHPYVFVDDRHKFLFCINNKVGSSNIIRVLMVLDGKISKSEPSNISVSEIFTYAPQLTRLNQFSRNQILYRLQHYKKVIFVREPLVRLISAYNEKFKYGKEPNFQAMAKTIVARIYPNKFNIPLNNKWYNLTFSEFIQYIIHPATIKEGYDTHWATYISVCRPCDILYDSIGKFETFNEDMNFLLKEIGVTNMRFPDSSSKSVSYLEEYYSGIPRAHLQRLKNIYADDSYLFNYKIPGVLENLL